MLFALSRDGVLPRPLARVSTAGAPVAALAVGMSISLAALLSFGLAGTRAMSAFFYLATMGVLSLLVMYVVTNAAALRFLFFAARRVPRWEIVFPLGGMAVAAYTLYRNLWPVPDYPFNVFPYVVAAWLALAVAAVWAVPGLARRIERHLATE